MRFPPEETAEKHVRILDSATRMFRDSGFTSVSISDIMKAAGLTHGSFYNHFDSKQALITECIMHAAGKTLGDMQKAKRTEAGHRAYVKQYLSVDHRDDPGSGCLMAALASEIGREQPAKRTMTRHVELFIEKMASHFPWSKRTNVRGDAIRMTATLVGALILARSVDDEKFSREILNEVTAGLLDQVGDESRQAA